MFAGPPNCRVGVGGCKLRTEKRTPRPTQRTSPTRARGPDLGPDAWQFLPTIFWDGDAVVGGAALVGTF